MPEIRKTLAIEVLVCPASSVGPGFGLAMPIMSSATNIQGLGRGVRSIKAIVGCCMELDEADLWEERDNVNHTGTWCRVWHATAVCCGLETHDSASQDKALLVTSATAIRRHHRHRVTHLPPQPPRAAALLTSTWS